MFHRKNLSGLWSYKINKLKNVSLVQHLMVEWTSMHFEVWWKQLGLPLLGLISAYFIISSQTVGSFWVWIYEGFYPYPRVITLPYPWWLAPKGTLPFNTLWKNLKPYPPLTLWRVRVRVYPRVTPLKGRKSPPVHEVHAKYAFPALQVDLFKKSMRSILKVFSSKCSLFRVVRMSQILMGKFMWWALVGIICPQPWV